MKSTVRLIVFGQALFYVAILVCIVLKPGGLSANRGISYYGIFGKTFLLYAAGLLGSGLLSWRAARRLRDPALWPLTITLTAIALFVALIAVTPYSVGALVYWLHTTAGAALFMVQLLASGWLVVWLRYRFWAVCLWLMEFCAGLICGVYLLLAHGLLLQFQLLFQLAFGILLIYSLGVLLPEESPEESS